MSISIPARMVLIAVLHNGAIVVVQHQNTLKVKEDETGKPKVRNIQEVQYKLRVSLLSVNLSSVYFLL
jgi:hypothetical protein